MTIIGLFLLIFISGFAWLIPLLFIFKNLNIALKISIPFSLSMEIIFGYYFYCVGTIRFFPIWYFGFVILANILAAFFIYKQKIIIKNNFAWKKYFSELKWINILVAVVIIGLVIYTRFFDSVTHVSPGNNDTLTQLYYLKDLLRLGFISSSYYAPGFQIIMLPALSFFSDQNIYRFAGPVIGLLFSLFGFLLIWRENNKLPAWFFLIISSLPIFNPLTLQTIGFFSSSLSFIYFLGLLYLVIDLKELNRLIKYLLFLLFCIGLALTVPYLFVQFIPALFMVWILSLISRKKIPGLARYLFVLIIISIIGFFIALGHVMLQTKILHKNIGESGFPSIPISIQVNDKLLFTNNYQGNILNMGLAVNNSGQKTKNISSEPPLNTFLNKLDNYFPSLAPMFNSGIDAIHIKNIRPFGDLLSDGAYILMILSLFLLTLQNKAVIVLGGFNIIFGIAIQTGVLELSYYRGRSGWYLLLLSILLIVYIFYKLPKFWQKRILWLFLILSISAILLPPIYYRPYYESEYSEVQKIAVSQKSELGVISDQTNINYIASNIERFNFTVDSYSACESLPRCILDLKKNQFIVNPILSQQALSQDKESQEFDQQQAKLRHNQVILTNEIENNPEFKKFKLIYEDNNIQIYEDTR
jgi:hypothetical protein